MFPQNETAGGVLQKLSVVLNVLPAGLNRLARVELSIEHDLRVAVAQDLMKGAVVEAV